ncbi:MAG: helix-turn-helix transcriptional regulator [Oscillospiraceae bacterium]|nr:helix-turn-helix transcriptional regulator [Oscillospiraceae bacterium]
MRIALIIKQINANNPTQQKKCKKGLTKDAKYDIIQTVEQLCNSREVCRMEQPYCECEVIHEDLVEEVRSKTLEKSQYIELATLFKLFGDGTRVQILHALEQHELCVCDLAALLGITKSAVSHQLKSLRLARLVKYRRDGQNAYYSLADDHVKRILDLGYEHLSE